MKFRLYFILLFVLNVSSYSCFAETISMTLDQATVYSGDTISLNINIDIADNTSGCAFTLLYPAEDLTFDSVSTEFFKTIYDNRNGADPSQIDPWQANDNAPGKIVLSGAYINPATGGPQYTGKQTLFSIHFTAKNNLQISKIIFEIEQTRILNTAAGWGAETTAEPAPIIVKSFPVGSAQWDTPSLEDDFETVLASFSSNPVLIVDVDTYYQDVDDDGYGNPNISLVANSQPSGYVTDNTDCNDNDGSVHPGATDVGGDGIDQDCNGSDLPSLNTYYLDSDGDGYGNPNISLEAESQPEGYVTDNTDSDDGNSNIHGDETCDVDTIFFDDFNSNTNGWLEGSNNSESLTINTGFYNFSHFLTNSSTFTIRQIPVDQTRDFEVETEIKKTGGDDPLAYFGLTWQNEIGSSYLDFAIDGFGFYSIYKVIEGVGTTLVGWSTTSALNQGIGQTNTLKIEKTDNTLGFYINDTLVHSIVAETLPGDYIGFIIGLVQDIAIDYLIVTQCESSISNCSTTPDVVTLIEPSGATAETSYALSWSSNDCSTWYKVLLKNAATNYKFSQWYEIEDNFNNYPEVDCSSETCSLILDISLPSGDYEWWVRGWNDNGNGPWSDGLSFTVQGDEAIPSKVTHTSPSGVSQDSMPTYTWVHDPASTWYKFWVGYPNGDKIFAQWYDKSDICSGETCSVTLETELMSGDYGWYVKSWNDFGRIWSDGMSFTVSE